VGKLCMNCHQSRQDAETYPTTPQDHFGPHYATQADMLIGTNVVTFGQQLPSSPHLSATDDACVDCHMYEQGDHGEHDPVTHELTTSGMHSFSMVSVNGEENVKACEGAGCHGAIGASFADKKYYDNGKADHDGDGEDEGLQDEVHGLLDTLAALLPAAQGHAVFDPHDDPDSTWTLTELQAAYNYKMVYYDHSYGIHNPAFIVSVLQTSINAMRDMLSSVDETPGIAPVAYGLSQNYPNPFNPTTEINFSIMKPGHVTLIVYDLLGRKVMTLVDKEMQAGTYKARFDASNLASGVYVYRIIAGNGDFTSVRKMVLLR